MFNKRWKKVLFWTLSVIVVLGVAGLFAANYAVDKLMSSMADGFNVEANETTSNAQGEIVEPPVAAGDATAEPNASAAPGSKVEPTTAVSPSSTPASDGAGDKKANNGGKAAASTSQPTSTPVPTPEGVDGIAHISTDKAKEVQESVTLKDKADVASIVAQQLSVSDIKRLQELAKGGLTNEEKKEARSIILSKVSEDQYNELVQVAKKYGLSQGKTYDQVTGNKKESEEATKEGSE
ncbi:hypothetical protein JI735_02340 [Paenibacillus sonchi]|uniref:Uncharacterized protein n=1 Tax=Paenibacillus sonchi TaxID=373687 RepID=A0A974PD31_9BACL|nr:hypothetical protein [Paenibacillus sonchi]QQZ61625.1 hypothetical protein JI735_02340 [Paenibacillus sonchi]